MKRRAPAWFKVALGVALGLMLSELAFFIRDDGAFPHVNFYVRDAQLGVRLRPNAHMRIAFGGNPASDIRTNSRGFRGGDWPAPNPSDVLVVGDSQVFGLGVNESETFSAKLEHELGGGAHVLNAGVPTYGPSEYTALVEELVRERKPEAVVYVLNMSNDLFELQHRNVDRHTVWDGWAVRKETSPASVIAFPFRAWLMAQSHLVYALRNWLHAPTGNDVGFSSEGSWREIANTARTTVPVAARTDGELRADLSVRRTLASDLSSANRSLMELFIEQVNKDDRRYASAAKQLSAYRGDPHDILARHSAEESRPISETAFQLLYAALIADENAGKLQQLAAQTHDARLRAALETRASLRAKVALEPGASVAAPPNPLSAVLERTQRACEAAGARLFVVALPLDVQVSSAEWKKYGHAPIDLGPTHVLIDDVVARARSVGARALDATPALAAAEPGAFLNGDLHMSPKGHAVLAQAIAGGLRSPAPALAPPPPGRSLLPLHDEFARVRDLPLPVLAAAGCGLKSVREWVELHCGGDGILDAGPSGFTLLSGGHGDAMFSGAGIFEDGEDYDSATVILPVLEGDDVRTLLHWDHDVRELHMRRDHAQLLGVLLHAPRKGDLVQGVLPRSLAADFADGNYYDSVCVQSRGWSDEDTCSLGTGAMKCLLDDQVQFGMLRRCVPRCSPSQPCKSGRCALFQGERGCIEP